MAVAPTGYVSATDEPAFRSISVGFDGSAEAETALRVAEALAGSLDVGLLLLAVVKPPDLGTAAYETGSAISAGYSFEAANDALDRLRAGTVRGGQCW